LAAVSQKRRKPFFARACAVFDFIGDKSEAAEIPEVQLLLGGYSRKDGEPVCFLEGWARNVYEWLGGGRFFFDYLE